MGKKWISTGKGKGTMKPHFLWYFRTALHYTMNNRHDVGLSRLSNSRMEAGPTTLAPFAATITSFSCDRASLPPRSDTGLHP